VVQPGKALMVLSPAGPTQLVVQIDEKNLHLLTVGQPAQASADAYPEQRFAAEVTYINPSPIPHSAIVCEKADTKKLQDALASLSATQQAVAPKNVLDPIIFFDDGSTIDTNSNILTMADGTQIDTTTGTKVIDTSSLIQMANGAYLDTKNNVLTMPDGTKIDTVTGLKISVTA